MNKSLRIALFSLMIASLAAFFVACSESVSVPGELMLNEDYKLFWSGDVNARSYSIKLTNLDDGSFHEYVTMAMSYQFKNLTEGNYEVVVKAISREKTRADSGWSEPLRFYKEYETGCVYELINGNREYQVSSFGSASGEIVIEDIYHGKPVTAIGERAFRGSAKVTKVTLGKNVLYVGDYAFANCSAITEIVLNDGLEYIGEGAFQQCHGLKTVDLPEKMTEINDLTFAYCSQLSSLTIPANVTRIGKSAFVNCTKLVEMDIPNAVTSIGESAFRSCSSLERVAFGSGLKTIGVDAFNSCSVLSDVVFSQESTLETIGNYAFAECGALESIDLPEGLKTISTRAFNTCAKLSDVNIPDSVTTVGQYSFAATKIYNDQVKPDGEKFIYVDDWVYSVNPYFRDDVKDEEENLVYEGITEITKDQLAGVKGIADRAFQQCFCLTKVVLSTSVKYIGSIAFGSCTELNRFSVPENGLLKEIGDYAFYNCKKLSVLNLREGLESIGYEAFRGCTNLTSPAEGYTVIPSTVRRIGQDAFYDSGVFDGLDEGVTAPVYFDNWVVGYVNGGEDTQITLKENTVGIADYAFNNFTTLKSVVGLARVKYIGAGAFWGCTDLERASFNQNLTEIRDYTFSQCANLFDADLPKDLKSIGVGAFMNCTTLNELSVPRRVVKIGENAFMGCINLKKVTFNDNLEVIGDRAFKNCRSLDSIIIPDSVTTIGERAFEDTPKATVLQIGESVERIGKMAFAYSGVTVVDIPDSVEIIDEAAFYACYGLTEITFGSGLKEIGDFAFAYGEPYSEEEGEEGSGGTWYTNRGPKSYWQVMGSSADWTESAEQDGEDTLEEGDGEEEEDGLVYNVTVKSIVLPKGLERVGKYAFFGMISLEYVFVPKELESMDICVFYECVNATVYTDAEGANEGWSLRFNPSFLPVVFNCLTDDDGQYVCSLVVKENTFANVTAESLPSDPVREGYDFVGWSGSEDGFDLIAPDKKYSLPYGVRLYAIWKKH